jgi:hypothetical protein
MSSKEIVPRCANLAVGVTWRVWGCGGEVLSTGKGLYSFKTQFRGKTVRPGFTLFLTVLWTNAVALSAYYKPNDKIL